MKIALIGDVHANLPALNAVLAHAREHGANAIWNIGDFVGYGPNPDEVVQRLREVDAVSIIGNYDRKVLQVLTRPSILPKQREKRLAFQWAGEHLSAESRTYLAAQPDERRFEALGYRVLLIHASPAAPKEHLGPETPESRLREIAAMANADVVICGHSHREFARKVDDVWFINTGSVGRPDDGDPRACYAILNLTAKHFEVTYYRVEYDLVPVLASLRDQGLPELFAQMLLHGRNLDAVRTLPEIWDEDRVFRAVQALAARCQFDATHAQQATRLALSLFDLLQPLHHLDERERHWLQYAGLLHDIGWSEGGQQHHKKSLRIIVESPLLPFNHYERLAIGSIARYHRRAFPSLKHEHFAQLSPEDQLTVAVLAGVLRAADGLDSLHRGAVHEVSGAIASDRILIRCQTDVLSEEERQSAAEKAELLTKVFARRVEFEWLST